MNATVPESIRTTRRPRATDDDAIARTLSILATLPHAAPLEAAQLPPQVQRYLAEADPHELLTIAAEALLRLHHHPR